MYGIQMETHDFKYVPIHQSIEMFKYINILFDVPIIF